MNTKNSFFVKLANEVGLSALDIGARGGVNEDLKLIGQSIEQYGFEPDIEECNRLNRTKNDVKNWKKLTFIPTGLSDKEGSFDLNLYRQRGCSSGLNALKEVGEIFSRGDYYIHDGTVTVKTEQLDQVVKKYNINNPSFMKIDVQGMEIDVFKGADSILKNDIVGIRTEVSFFPLYNNLPLFAEVDQFLRPYGFVPIRWLESHEWRRLTRKKYPETDRIDVPFSRGQLIHADVLYLLHPEVLQDNSEAQIKRLIRLALVSVCYKNYDHAYSIFSMTNVKKYINERFENDPLSEIINISKSECGLINGIKRNLLRRLRAFN